MRAWLRLGTAFAIAICTASAAGLAQTWPGGEQLAQADPRRIPASRAPTAVASGEGGIVAKINNWTVGLAAGLPEGTFLRFGAEIARNLNDGEELRVLATVTPGATDNVKDLLYLKGMDIAITHADVFEHFRTVDKIPNIERRVNFISEMYISELHVLVRPEINSFKDLEGKKVSFHTPGAGPSVTGPILFQRLGVKVEPVYVNNAIAYEKMKSGEIFALIHTVGKPNDLFIKNKNDAGFKFLPVPFDKFDDLYVPSVFTPEDYPGYVKPGEKVETHRRTGGAGRLQLAAREATASGACSGSSSTTSTASRASISRPTTRNGRASILPPRCRAGTATGSPRTSSSRWPRPSPHSAPSIRSSPASRRAARHRAMPPSRSGCSGSSSIGASRKLDDDAGNLAG